MIRNEKGEEMNLAPWKKQNPYGAVDDALGVFSSAKTNLERAAAALADEEQAIARRVELLADAQEDARVARARAETVTRNIANLLGE